MSDATPKPEPDQKTGSVAHDTNHGATQGGCDTAGAPTQSASCAANACTPPASPGSVPASPEPASPELPDTDLPSSDLPSCDELPNCADGFERLWTPHRMVYIGGQGKPKSKTEADCPFCVIQNQDDVTALIVHRTSKAFVVLNLFPYNPGHLLICPNRHLADYTEIDAEETEQIAELTKQSMKVLRASSNPHGFNLGINQGDVAGAGVAAHLHQHVVPRWTGDANFLPIVAQTKAVPQLLSQTREILAAKWSELYDA